MKKKILFCIIIFCIIIFCIIMYIIIFPIRYLIKDFGFENLPNSVVGLLEINLTNKEYVLIEEKTIR